MDNTLSSMWREDANGQRVKLTHPSEVCSHSEEERAFIAVVDHSELEHALTRGYRVGYLYNSVTWPEKDPDGSDRWTTDIFKSMSPNLTMLNFFQSTCATL